MVRNRKETTEKSKKKPGLSTQIFIALLAGALLGVVIHYWIPSSYIKDTVIVEGVLYVIGQGFIRLMQMLVVPLVFCSLICGATAIGDSKTLGKVGINDIRQKVFISHEVSPCQGSSVPSSHIWYIIHHFRDFFKRKHQKALSAGIFGNFGRIP